MVNETVSLISFSDILLLVYKNTRELCVLILYPENWPNSKLKLCIEINSKWIKDKCKAGYYKTLREKHKPKHSDINDSNIFSTPSPRVIEIKTKNKWDIIKLKNFSTSKEAINETKRQPIEWEKILANKATDKELISKICKHLM